MKILIAFIGLYSLYLQPPQQQKVDSLNQLLSEASGKEEVHILNELFKVYQQNEPSKALSYAEQALVLAQYIDDKAGESSSLNNIGVIYRHFGNLDKALSSYIASLKIQEDNGFEDAIAYTYSNIGTIYSLKDEPNTALEYFKKANAKFEEIDHHLRKVGTLNNIGNVYSKMGNYDSALFYYLKSMEEYNRLEDKSQAFVPLTNIGNLYFNKGNMEKALEYYNKSLVLEQAANNVSGQASALHSFGSVFKNQGDIDNAIAFFEQALEKAQEVQDNFLLKIVYESLSESYFAKGDHFMAYSFLQLRNVVNDSLFNEQSSQRISELKSAFNFEQQQKEIAHLQTETKLQQLQLKQDHYIIIAGTVVIVIIGLLVLYIIKENREIRRNKKLLEVKNEEITEQKRIIEQKNFNITESINYAKRVQSSMLNFSISDDKRNQSFILFKPKDIVSGDFFWYTSLEDCDLFVTADCTGHGVAGAFMTIISVSLLNEIINHNKETDPKTILRKLDEKIKKTLTQDEASSTTHSVDLGICAIYQSQKEVVFSGANRPLYYFSSGEFCEIKGAKSSIGDSILNEKNFVNHQIIYNTGDTFYMTSDGYADQFGGENDKKFMTKRLKELLKEIHKDSLKNQKNILKIEVENWMKNTEQTDDIIVSGFRL